MIILSDIESLEQFSEQSAKCETINFVLITLENGIVEMKAG